MLTLKLTTIGKSAGLIFPKEALSRLKLQKGDTLFLTETKEGYLLTPYHPEFEAQMQQAEDVMSRYPNTLKDLAKEPRSRTASAAVLSSRFTGAHSRRT